MALWAAGCMTVKEDLVVSEDEGTRLWPAPPERPRFAWEIDLRSAADLVVDDEKSRMERLLTGATVTREPVFDKPTSVAAQGGRIYVTDSVQRRIVVFDVPRRRVFAMGLRSPGTVQKPSSVAIDKRGMVYVADTSLRKVLVYDGLGLFQRTIGSPALLERPTGVAVDAAGERIYVIDRGDVEGDRHRVLVFDAKGRLSSEIGRRGTAPGEFNIPVQGTVSPDGTLWVLDAGNFRVQGFDRDGRYLRSFGKPGNELGNFARPRGIASDAEGRLYVSDASFGNVQIFTPEGQLLIALGRASRRDRPGNYGLVLGVGVDETGRIYVVDQLFNKIDVLRPVDDAEAQRLLAQDELSRSKKRAP